MSALAKSCSSSTLSVLAASPLPPTTFSKKRVSILPALFSSGRLFGGRRFGTAGFFAVFGRLFAGFFVSEALVAVFFAGAFLTGAFLTEEALVTDFFAGAFLAAGFFSAVSSEDEFCFFFIIRRRYRMSKLPEKGKGWVNVYINEGIVL